jgi:hypothetical protein
MADDDEEELPDIDYADPLKRRPDEEDDDAHGLDPTLTIPPED